MKWKSCYLSVFATIYCCRSNWTLFRYCGRSYINGTYLKYILIYWKVFSALFLLVLCFLVGISLWRKFLCQPIRIQVFVCTTEILATLSLMEINQFNLTRGKWNYSGSFNFSLVKVNWLITLRDNLTWFQCQRQILWFLLVCTKTFYHNEMPTKMQSQI